MNLKQVSEYSSGETFEEYQKRAEDIIHHDANGIFRHGWQSIPEETYREIQKANPIQDASFDDGNENDHDHYMFSFDVSRLSFPVHYDAEESCDDENSAARLREHVNSSLVSKCSIVGTLDDGNRSILTEETDAYDEFDDSSDQSITVDCYVSFTFSSDSEKEINGLRFITNSFRNLEGVKRTEPLFQDESCRLYRCE